MSAQTPQGGPAVAPAIPATQTAEGFLARYNDRDVQAMIDLFAPGGIVEHVPLALKARSRRSVPAVGPC